MAVEYPKNEDGTYQGLNFTSFPPEVDSWQDSIDVSAELLPYVNQYREAMEQNNITVAERILSEHPELIRMMISATDINEMKHGIMAIERWINENIEEYLGQYTESAQQSSESAKEYAESSASSSQEANTSMNAAYQSQIAAEQAKVEANSLVEDLRSLTGSLPSDFTEYVEQMDGVRDYVDDEVLNHNKNEESHEDLRDELAKAQLDIQILKLYHESSITSNTFAVSFETLDDVTVTNGTWDVVNDRIYF